jgi:hypothetical protein
MQTPRTRSWAKAAPGAIDLLHEKQRVGAVWSGWPQAVQSGMRHFDDVLAP